MITLLGILTDDNPPRSFDASPISSPPLSLSRDRSAYGEAAGEDSRDEE